MTDPKDNRTKPLWAVTGAAGLFGRAFLSALTARGERAVALVHSAPSDLAGIAQHKVDITDPGNTESVIASLAPDVVVNAAALTSVDFCETHPQEAMAINAEGAVNVARSARAADARCLHISTDHLWTGETSFRDEDAPPQPVNVYARSKAEAETGVIEAAPDALIVRTTFYGTGHPTRRSLSDAVIDTVSRGETFTGFTDSFFTPLALGQLISLLLELVERDAGGIYHLGSRDRLSKYEFAKRLCRNAGFDEGLIQPIETQEAALAAPRPRDLSLSCGKAEALLGHAMPDVDAGIAMVLAETAAGKRRGPQQAMNR